MNEITNANIIEWLKNLSHTYKEKENYLTDLDREIGDADHGFNMSRGFEAVESKVVPLAKSDIGTILKTTAMTLISTVGGASGPLFGSFFLKASMTANGKNSLNTKELGTLLEAGLQSVLDRGKAIKGDKTMIDALQPAVEAFKKVEDESLSIALEKASIAAREGAESTIPLLAKKGRASYLGERSVGHKDPGSESTAILFEELYKTITQS